MDALKRPLRIPPDFSNYAEEKGIFQLYERMLQELIVARPEDPLQFLVDYLGKQQEDGTRLDPYKVVALVPRLNAWGELCHSFPLIPPSRLHSAQSDYLRASSIWAAHSGK